MDSKLLAERLQPRLKPRRGFPPKIEHIQAALLLARGSVANSRAACRAVPGVPENSHSGIAALAVRVREQLTAAELDTLPPQKPPPPPQPLAPPEQPAPTTGPVPMEWDLPPLQASREPPVLPESPAPPVAPPTPPMPSMPTLPPSLSPPPPPERRWVFWAPSHLEVQPDLYHNRCMCVQCSMLCY